MQKKLTVGPKGSKLYQNMDKMGQVKWPKVIKVYENK